MSRPEHSYAPQIFYDDAEAKKYSTSSRMMNIQREITKRALELLNLDEEGPKFLLDVGCGSGLSGQVISDYGHDWIGLDISGSMLNVARDALNKDEAEARGEDDEDDEDMEESEDDDGDDEDMEGEELGSDGNDTETPAQRGRGDLMQVDMGQGLPFRPNSFDGMISISAVQWLCNAYEKSHIPMKRLKTFFGTLYSLLRRGARAVIQLYPETPQQMEMITTAAMASGFTGGVVVDYPNSTKAKKFYLVLFAGGSTPGGGQQQLPRALGTSQTGAPQAISFEKDRIRHGKVKKRDTRDQPSTKSRDWVLKKKDRQRKQGRDVRPDSKYSGRKRKGAF